MSEVIKEFDCVMLNDGREVVVLEVLADGKAYMVEIADNKGHVVDTPIIGREEISKITYIHKV